MADLLPLNGRAAQLVRLLQLQPHPEGGYFRELFRSQQRVQPLAETPGRAQVSSTPSGGLTRSGRSGGAQDERAPRSALTCIDFLLARGQFSAWHRVASDEAWHLLEGGPLRLWLLPPTLQQAEAVLLDRAGANGAPRHVVPAGWWQAAEPLGDYAYVGATVGPGFEFADFGFGREDAALKAALARLWPELQRLL